eukprot:CAMPEP_0194496576 /NCGR_PEP_ID=MMETSP0253-20130528/13809_1 /TAXON_ID=2966 /ORGANISM="Noctiluca scintillans" /LENGTH=174 /DNA_ID=CAMNT_0039337995 /DNA_START=76 /DNA_END=600 /DNA_ORIENTATION=+
MAVQKGNYVRSLATAVKRSVDAESDRVASVMSSMESTEPDLYEEVMHTDSAVTNLLRFVQLCVKCKTSSTILRATRRNDARAAFDDEELWRLERLTGCFTSHDQKVVVLKELLASERRVCHEVQKRPQERFLKFWLFMEQSRLARTAVRHRHWITPPRSGRRRVSKQDPSLASC